MTSENTSAGQNGSGPHWQQLFTERQLDIDGILHDLPRAPFNGQSQSDKVTTIQQGLALPTEPGQVVELRILGIHGKKRTDSGYFDDLHKLAKAAAAYDGKAEGLYFTLNPVNPALIARAHNRVREYAQQTTSDHDIVRRITLPIDFDPVRPAGISSNEQEKQAALERAWLCRAWLIAQGWPEPVYASSGNGAHILYAIDLPNTAESNTLVRNCLSALSVLFSDDKVKVDASTSNASRIFKLYGTLACKGDHTPERPHRRAAILAAPPQRQAVLRERLEALAAQAPQPERLANTPPPSTSSSEVRTSAYGKAALDKELAILAATRENRNIQLFQSAAALFSLVAGNVLDRTEVCQALLSTALQIGLPDIEARRTIASAEHHGQEQPRKVPDAANAGNNGHTPFSSSSKPSASLPSNTRVSSTQATAEQLLMHVDELDGLPPIRWLIRDVLPANSLVELHGAPGAGKTQVMFDMAQTLAASGQTVIYVVAEGLQGYRGRKRAWQQFRKQSGGSLFLWRQPVHLFEPPAVRLFIDTIKRRQPALIVFDTLSRCSLGADENNQKDMGFILESLDVVRRETGATVVAVHHTNAAGLRERGSTVIRGGMDVMIEVSKDDDLVVVSCSKMKDARDFDALCLKPVLVDIGESNPVPVLVPAEKRIQTQADKLTPLQLEILRAVGMEMFAESGIKSNQLDDLLPPSTKRSSKYHSLNTLIRLGYVNPHIKGDPYRITDAGRLKLSNAENSLATAKSNMSNPGPNGSIWTLVDPSPMSSPIPHTDRCGMDETLDQTGTTQTRGSEGETNPIATGATTAMSKVQERGLEQEPTKGSGIVNSPLPAGSSTVQTRPDEPQTTADGQANPSTEPGESQEQAGQAAPRPMAPFEIARYATQIGITYPTTDGSELYRIAALIPPALRAAFEEGLGEAVRAFYDEVGKQGHDPAPQPVPDVLALYLLPGLVSAAEVFAAYQRAREAGHAQSFEDALRERNDRALEILKRWLQGRRSTEAVFIPRPAGDAWA